MEKRREEGSRRSHVLGAGDLRGREFSIHLIASPNVRRHPGFDDGYLRGEPGVFLRISLEDLVQLVAFRQAFLPTFSECRLASASSEGGDS